ncbi:MAG: sensor histidine kinase [Algicola sp.]|nr:sensor histidine kinase [Algicola sp.]
MAIRITMVALAVSILSYLHIVKTFEKQTYDKLEKYIQERGARESDSFTLAENYHDIFQREFLSLLELAPDVTKAQFDSVFIAMPDGTTRMDIALFDGVQHEDGSISRGNSAYIGMSAPIDDQDFRNRLMTSYRLADRFGMAWINRFANFYVVFPENAIIVHWPDVAWGTTAATDLDVKQEEWFTVADISRNPQRETIWTGMYYDYTADKWLISCITPIDFQGKHLVNVGQDYELNSMLEGTYNRNFEGAYNFIFREDGRLIAHPEKIQLLKKAAGVLNIQNIDDPTLQSLYQQVLENVKSMTGDTTTFFDEKNDVFVAVAKIKGPDWWFVMVYPKELLLSAAKTTAQFIFALSVVSLVVELAMLFLVLRFKVVYPLKLFVGASTQITEGHYDKVASGLVALPEKRKDEVGLLARMLRTMAQKIEQNIATIKETQQQLVLQEKMASLGTLTAGVAHEINNPTNFVHVGVENLDVDLKRFEQFIFELMGDDADEEIIQSFKQHFAGFNEHMVTVKDGTVRIKTIVEDLRVFTQLDNTDRKPANIVDCIESTLNLVKTQYLEVAQFVTQLDDVPEFECYPAKLNQVFMNVIINACDAIEEKRTQQGLTKVGLVNIACKVEDEIIMIEVKDDGCGMSDETKNKLFEPFYTTKTVGKGTGLGMAISFGIIEEHGGTIEVESSVNKGTSILLKLPLNPTFDALPD